MYYLKTESECFISERLYTMIKHDDEVFKRLLKSPFVFSVTERIRGLCITIVLLCLPSIDLRNGD